MSVRVCRGNSVFYSVLRVGITVAKFASQVVKFYCYGVSVEDRVCEVKGYKLMCLLSLFVM